MLSRQKLPNITLEKANEGVTKGAYVLADPEDGQAPQVILIATGSEVSLTLAAKEILAHNGIAARVVSMPSWELFEKKSKEYKDSILLPDIKHRLAVEMAHLDGNDIQEIKKRFWG